MNPIDFFRLRSLRKRARSARDHVKLLLVQNRDILPEGDAASLRETIDSLARAARSRDVDEIQRALDEADAACSAAVPPKPLPALRELVETLVVAFGVAMAFRAYFFQPFKIPTGSMQPTLFGHHSEYCDKPAWYDEMPFKPFAWLVTGRWYMEVVAPSSGRVEVYVDRARAPGYVFLRVAGQDFRIPQDAYDRGEVQMERLPTAGMADAGGGRRIVTTGTVRTGTRLWSGYSIAGDHVFVNRMKWYFRPPRRGEVMVFGTDGNLLLPQGEFYIKRLCGLPGETVSFDPPFLTVDGKRVTEPDPILRVAEKRPAGTPGYDYLGYRFAGRGLFGSAVDGSPHETLLGDTGDSIRLGQDEYLPFGDNTVNSYDGRYWGAVKRNRLVGNGSCVYWPFSPRWGRVE